MELRVFISYTHDSPEHEARIWALSERLREDGVECHIDQHEQSPKEGWPHWCSNQLETSDFVLVVCTELYRSRYNGEGTDGKGRGGNWEGLLIRQSIYDARGKTLKFVPVVVSPTDVEFVPPELRGPSHFDLSQTDGYEKLFRFISAQPVRTPRPVAPQLRQMPQVHDDWDEKDPVREELARIQAYRRDKLIDEVVAIEAQRKKLGLIP